MGSQEQSLPLHRKPTHRMQPMLNAVSLSCGTKVILIHSASLKVHPLECPQGYPPGLGCATLPYTPIPPPDAAIRTRPPEARTMDPLHVSTCRSATVQSARLVPSSPLSCLQINLHHQHRSRQMGSSSDQGLLHRLTRGSTTQNTLERESRRRRTQVALARTPSVFLISLMRRHQLDPVVWMNHLQDGWTPKMRLAIDTLWRANELGEGGLEPVSALDDRRASDSTCRSSRCQEGRRSRSVAARHAAHNCTRHRSKRVAKAEIESLTRRLTRRGSWKRVATHLK